MADQNTMHSGHATPGDLQHPDEILPSLVDLFEPASHNICEFGDITLVIEDGYHPQLRLKVNSCILASTSKVFRTLFRGCFAEGDAIRSGTREVYMNDKPAPMLAPCQLLHLKPIEPIIDDEDNILEFALLVDKFDCVQALRSATDGILHRSTATCCDQAYSLTASAYILDHPFHFRQFTKAAVHNYATLYPPELDPKPQLPSNEHLLASVQNSISHQQIVVRNELGKCLTNILHQFTAAAYSEHKPNLVYQFMTTMEASELRPIWPVTSRPRSLADQLAAFSSLEVPIIFADQDRLLDWSYPYENMPQTPRVPSRTVSHNNASAYLLPGLRTVPDLSKRLEDLCIGLCLDCTRGNNTCHLPHPKPWAAYRDSLQQWFKNEFLPEEHTTPVMMEVAEQDEQDFWGW